MKNTFVGLVLSLSFVLALQAPAQAAHRNSGEVVQATGEVFLKGSIDGKHMFMVLGMQDGAHVSKDIAKWAVKGKDLTDLGHDIYNQDHRGDTVSRVKDGARISKAASHEIFRPAWKSLQKIPQAYKVDLGRAQDAYYGSHNQAAGVLKYAGWAVWANIEGAYYLVVEAPVEFAAMSVATVGGVPGALLVEGLVIAWDTGKILFKYVAGATAIAAVETYSFLSSSTATVLTLVAAGAIATYEGGKWLVYGLPHSLRHPVRVSNELDISYEDEERVAEAVSAYLQAHVESTGFAVEPSLRKYNSKIKLMLKDKAGLEAITVTVTSNKAKVVLKAEASRAYYKLRCEQDAKSSKKQVKAQIGAELLTLLKNVEASLNAAPTDTVM